ncbi:unnamed protein product [Enterobius vermicularis]|uniref:C-type lectin domain-containing protein n=1 Tax=Enterobius vermicularis TaxID=51028 RepID=A0A0N4V5M0_ENTVE|nr:unnamed protein product [Enterobius vermicularis]
MVCPQFAGILCKKCDNGWQYFWKTNKCYLSTSNTTNWSYAELECQARYAHLVTINDDDENNFIRATATFSGLEPAYNQTARCLKMNIESGEWYPASCFLSSLPYICEKAADVGNLPNRKWFKPAKTTAEKCEFGWTYFEQTNYCYYFVKKPKTWEHANSFCQKKSAHYAASKGFQILWIGSAWFHQDDYENNDRSPFDYSNWGKSKE